MQTAAILDISTIAYLDVMHITTHHGVEPDGDIVTHLHIAHNHGTFTEIAVLAIAGSRHPLKFLEYCHWMYVLLFFCAKVRLFWRIAWLLKAF
jgi:hypothetical protein